MSALGATVGSVPSSLETGSRLGLGVCPQPATTAVDLAGLSSHRTFGLSFLTPAERVLGGEAWPLSPLVYVSARCPITAHTFVQPVHLVTWQRGSGCRGWLSWVLSSGVSGDEGGHRGCWADKQARTSPAMLLWVVWASGWGVPVAVPGCTGQWFSLRARLGTCSCHWAAPFPACD